MQRRLSLLLAVSAISLTAGAAYAETAAPVSEVGELVVTGSRSAPRTKLDTVAPVDVVSSQQITQAGNTELAQTLSVALPSLNFPRPTLTDGTDTIRPATLRGLAPDETLVLVNSKRRHSSSLVNVNGSVGRGSAAVDLNTIPTAGINSVEVLRDGASAQYGSDAIAGVVNIRLKEARSGGGVSLTLGEHDTTVDTLLAAPPVGATWQQISKRRVRDGATTTISGWTGLPLGDTGFLTVSAESKVQSHTTRAGYDNRQQYPLVNGAFDPREATFNRLDAWYGDPQLEQYTLFGNAGYDTSGGAHLYGWASYQHRDAISAGNFRRAIQQNVPPASASQNIIAVYPDGFLPKIEGTSTDGSAAAGASFKGAGWDWDASVVWGLNKLHFGVIDSLNVTLGPTGQHSFDAGALQYQQVVGNLGATRAFDMSGTNVNVAAGVEARWEEYRIIAGEPASYNDGGYRPQVGAPAAFGAQVFPGFTPANATNQDRTAVSGYLDIEAKPTEAFDIDGALRAEHYSDFGNVLTGKLAARYDFNSNFALRGAVSNGFRAPSLQQSYFTATSTNFINGVPFQVVTVPAGSAIAKVLGSENLKPERSVNVSGGAVFRSGDFALTVDAYWIRLKDRIALSENLTQANVVALLPVGITGVRFFTNGVDTETRGIEAVASYRWNPSWDIGRFNFTLSGSHNSTKITRLPTTNVLSQLNPAPLLIARVNSLTLTDGQPKWKGSFVVDWSSGPFSVTTKTTYYGSLLQPGTTLANDLPLKAKTLFDVEGRLKVNERLTAALGAENLFDVYPTKVPGFLNSSGTGAWPEYSPFGFQGRYIYGRVSYNW